MQLGDRKSQLAKVLFVLWQAINQPSKLIYVTVPFCSPIADIDRYLVAFGIVDKRHEKLPDFREHCQAIWSNGDEDVNLPRKFYGASALCSLGALCLLGCDALAPSSNSREPTASNLAYQRWAEACPDDVEDSRQTFERARTGDLQALECGILFYTFSETPLTDDEAETMRVYADVERDPVPSAGSCRLLNHLYVRWRLTGEGWEEMETLARTLTRSDIEAAFVTSTFDPSVAPRVHLGADNLIAEDDPRRDIYDLGLGPDHKSVCSDGPPRTPGGDGRNG